jgi:hypothetical protein
MEVSTDMRDDDDEEYEDPSIWLKNDIADYSGQIIISKTKGSGVPSIISLNQDEKRNIKPRMDQYEMWKKEMQGTRPFVTTALTKIFKAVQDPLPLSTVAASNDNKSPEIFLDEAAKAAETRKRYYEMMKRKALNQSKKEPQAPVKRTNRSNPSPRAALITKNKKQEAEKKQKSSKNIITENVAEKQSQVLNTVLPEVSDVRKKIAILVSIGESYG